MQKDIQEVRWPQTMMGIGALINDDYASVSQRSRLHRYLSPIQSVDTYSLGYVCTIAEFIRMELESTTTNLGRPPESDQPSMPFRPHAIDANRDSVE